MDAAVKIADLDALIRNHQEADQQPVNMTRLGAGSAAEMMHRIPARLYAGSAASVCERTHKSERLNVFAPHRVSVKDAVIVGRGAIMAPSGHLLTGPQTLAFQNAPHAWTAWGFGTDIRGRADAALSNPKRRRTLTGPVTVICRPGDHIYGHWLVDILPRVFLLECEQPGQFRYICPKALPAFARNFLGWLGVGPDRLIPFDGREDTLHVEDLTLITNVRQGNFVSPDFSFRSMADTIRGALGISLSDAPDETLILTRRNWTNTSRSMLNREAVDKIMVQSGYALWAPETDTLPEQIARFSRAKIIAGESGSALHNSIFMPRGSSVLCFQSRSDGSHVQSALTENMDQSIGFIFGESFDRKGLGRQADWVLPEDGLSAAAQPLLVKTPSAQPRDPIPNI